MRSAAYSRFTANTLVKSGPGLLLTATVTSGSSAATLTLYDGLDSSGAIITILKEATTNNTRQTHDYHSPVAFSRGLYAEITGTSAEATVVYE